MGGIDSFQHVVMATMSFLLNSFMCLLAVLSAKVGTRATGSATS